DLLSLTRQTDTITVNGRIFQSVYDAASKTTTTASAAGRQGTVIIDAQGRVIQAQKAGRLPVNLSYDPRGHLASLTQGAGLDARTVTFSYTLQGFVDTITDPLGRALSSEYDAAGRVTRLTLPDGRAILYTYDFKGNLTSLTPPGRPAHDFTYTALDQTAE